MTAPAQKPSRSEQVVGTPREFVEAVERRFGKLHVDLAALKDNAVVPAYYGPDHDDPWWRDSLACSWHAGGLCWLNPPFKRIEPWVAKCKTSNADVLLLTLASVGSNWFADHVHGVARVHFLRPRLTFVGHTQPYPKDLILSHFGPGVVPGYECWRWKP